MAFVAISRDFISRVQSKIQTMANAETKTLGDKPVITANANSPDILKATWGEHIHLHGVIPNNWMRHSETVRLQFQVPGAEGTPNETTWCFEIKTNSGSFDFPPNYSWYDNKDIDPSTPLLATLVEYATKAKEIEARWRKVNDQVLQFLESCKSANEAIKLWPEVITYFHPDDVKRLEAKTARSGGKDSAAAAVLAGIDQGEVMSAAVIARLSGAQV